MNRSIPILLVLFFAVPGAFAQDYRQQYSQGRQRSFSVVRPGETYRSPYQNSSTGWQSQQLHDPVYQGNFNLLGSVRVDQNLMKVWTAARDAHFVLDQLSSTMSSCMQMDEQEERLKEDFKVLESHPAGKAASAKYRQVESLVRQAKGEFDAYHASLTGGHDVNNPHVKAGNDFLEQARKILNGSRSFLQKLGDAAQGVAGAAAELAKMIQQMTASNNQQSQTPPVAPPFDRPIQGNNTATNSDTNNPPDSGSFAKPEVPSSQPNHPNLDAKLKKFAEALLKRALDNISDPAARAKLAYNLKEKFEGIGEGLNEAKEEVKHAAQSAFNAAVQEAEAFQKDPVGTLNAAAEAAVRFGQAFANGTEQAIDAASKDSRLFDNLFRNAVADVAEALNNYSSLPQRQQGKILGKALFWSINPGGSTQGAELAGQAFKRAGSVLKPHANQLASELKQLYGIGKGKLAAASEKLAQSAAKWGAVPQLAEAGAYAGPRSGAWQKVLPKDDPLKLFMEAEKNSGGGRLPPHGGGGLPSGSILSAELASSTQVQRLLKGVAATGEILPEVGREATQAIRTALKASVPAIDKKNIAVAVLEMNGETELLYGVSGGNVPGAPVPKSPIFKVVNSGAMTRSTDSEYKILEAIAEKLRNNPGSKFSLSVFSELEPCSQSCKGVIDQFRSLFGSRMQGTGFPPVSSKFKNFRELSNANWEAGR